MGSIPILATILPIFTHTHPPPPKTQQQQTLLLGLVLVVVVVKSAEPHSQLAGVLRAVAVGAHVIISVALVPRRREETLRPSVQQDAHVEAERGSCETE